MEKRLFTKTKKKNTDSVANPCNRKVVVQLDKANNVLAEYSSITEASKATNVNGGNISSVCNNKLKTAGGFQWKYKQK